MESSEVEVMREFLSTQSLPQTQNRTTCPVCGPDRHKTNDRSLSVKVDKGHAVYLCHHCDAKGKVSLTESVESDVAPDIAPDIAPDVAPDVEPKDGLSKDQLVYLSRRGISTSNAKKCGLISGQVYIPSRKQEVACIGFPYVNADGSHAVKYRDGKKNFTQRGSARSLWRINEWTGGDLIICEGELDATSFQEIGVFATSVPNGAPSSRVEDRDSKKFSYLWDAKEILKKADRIILAVDSDEPGTTLAEEIARRIGKARCWRTVYPVGSKDPNDVLIQHGPDGLRKVLDEATPWPVAGLRNVSEYRAAARSLYEFGMDRGQGSGVSQLDWLFKTNPQTLNVVTGIPGSGKSAFLTWLSVRLAKRHNWNCAVFSAECSTEVHILQLAAAYTGKPFVGSDKMSREELEDGMDWIAERFVFLDESETTIDSILERAEVAVLRNGVRLLIIDPYNFLTGAEDSVSGINKLLVSLKTFSVQHSIAIFLVAHPTKMYRGSDGNFPSVGPYDISGSSGFFNTADSILVIGRVASGQTLVKNCKARYPWIGNLGELTMDFDFRAGVFSVGEDDDDINIETSEETEDPFAGFDAL